MGIISDGPVASVALFSSRPVEKVRSIALDTSSRASTGLVRVLCREAFGIEPDFVPMPPGIQAMLEQCDAALLIGDPALYLNYEALGILKIDLGEQWTRFSGLPFVWAFWAGRSGVLSGAQLAALTAARDAGVAASDRIADDYCGPERAKRGRVYLRDNIQYTLDDRAVAGLKRYFTLAHKHGLVEANHDVTFY
jgi:chorismate dehydratase